MSNSRGTTVCGPELLVDKLKEILDSINSESIFMLDEFEQKCKAQYSHRDYCEPITNLFRIIGKAPVICIPPISNAEIVINWYSQNKNSVSINDGKNVIFKCCSDDVINDARIQAFISFDDFDPRPAPVDPAPPEKSVDFPTYLEQNKEKCSPSPEHFQDCKKSWEALMGSDYSYDEFSSSIK